MSGNVLGSLDLAQQLAGVTAYTTVVDFDDLDLAFRVDHEGSAIGQAGFFDQHVEVARDDVGWVTDQRVLDLADGFRSVVPGFVGEVGVGGHTVDFHAQLLELGVVVSKVTQLGRADEGEVGRVEEHDRPLALQVGFAYLNEFAVVEGGGVERFDLAVDDRHERRSFMGLKSVDGENPNRWSSKRLIGKPHADDWFWL